ncbi:MAG TPA: hypothetical protein VHW01_15565, partial [Polyangiaceae bacterium]|nr:hypothetical protein [Polyangiaceae bacterium]
MRPLLAVMALTVLTTTACSSSSSSAGSGKATSITFNEINAAGDEWLELYNSGSSDFDIGSYAVADTDKDTGAARVTKAMRFPA